MSVLTTLLPFLVKEAPHAEELLTEFAALTKQARAVLDKLPSASNIEREVHAAMTALETAAQQGLNGIAKLGARDAAAVSKALQGVVADAKTAVHAAVATAKKS